LSGILSTIRSAAGARAHPRGVFLAELTNVIL
jgi:hypothetical protein